VTNAVYDRLRSIGVSVETADALAPVVAGLSPRKREAFFLWAEGMTYREAGRACLLSKNTVMRVVKNVNKMGQNASKI